MRPSSQTTLLALAAALSLLAACSGEADDPSAADPPGDDGGPPGTTDCRTVHEGSWTFDLLSVFGGPLLDNATLIQNGCLVFAEQDDWRLSGTLDELDRWTVEITRSGEVVGHFLGTFDDELESPLFRFYSEEDGELDGVPLLEVTGTFNPAGLSITSYSPDRGSTTGGAEIEVTGAGFLDYELEFIVDGRDAEVLNMLDDGTAVLRLPPGDEEGLVDVTALSADEFEGGATASFTFDESFTYSPCIVVTPGDWALTIDGAEESGSFEQTDCDLTLMVAAEEGEPLRSFAGPIDVVGAWTINYLVDGISEGGGQALFEAEPARSFSGTVQLNGGGTLSISGELPEPESDQ